MDKRSTQKDGSQGQDVRKAAINLIYTFFALLLFIIAIYAFYTNSVIIVDSSRDIFTDILFFVLAIIFGVIIVTIVTISISLYKRRKWLWQKKGEMFKVCIHEVRLFVKPEVFRPFMQALLTAFAIFSLIIGILWGYTSHDVHYFQTIPKETPFDITPVISDNNNEDIYFRPTKDRQIYYVIHAKDFTAPFTSKILFNSHHILSMICKHDRDDLFIVDVTLDDNSILHGVGCTVVEIRLQQQDPRQILEFRTTEYATNRSNYYQNNWPWGAGITGASVLFIVAIWLLPSFWRRKTNSR